MHCRDLGTAPLLRQSLLRQSLLRRSLLRQSGGGPRVVVSTAAFHARVRGSVPGLGGLKETKMFLPHPRVKVSIAGSLREREVACSASDRQGSNFESRVWRTVSSQSSHHPQEVLLAQFSLYVHKGGLKPDSFHFIYSDNHCSDNLFFYWFGRDNSHFVVSLQINSRNFQLHTHFNLIRIVTLREFQRYVITSLTHIFLISTHTARMHYYMSLFIIVYTHNNILHFSTMPQHASTSIIAHKGVTTSEVIIWKLKRINLLYSRLKKHPKHERN